MTTTTFIGIDLAWKSERNPSGVAVLQGDRDGARLIALSTISAERSVADFVTSNTSADTVVAIDAPLIIINETGQRGCETAVGRRYGSREASCHTSNLRLYSGAASVALTAQLASHGFVHVDPMKPQPEGRLMAEVYPHAAMVALWNLPKTIKYKRGSALENRKGLNTLRTHLSGLSRAEPPLRKSGVLSELLTADLNQLSGKTLKNHEDRLDALFCAYLAYYFWYWGWERNEIFGDLESGYILNPKLRADIRNDDTSGHHSDSQFTDHTSFSAIADSESMTHDYAAVITQAHQLARPMTPSELCSAGSVASVIVSRSGKTYTGICLDFACSLGFCAEHAAVAEMLKANESEIALVVAVDEHGAVLPPCGRCREMMWQLNSANKAALVILAHDRAVPLRDLLPFR
jgi:predicted RNase H-like nuclease/cytidine deaminase